MLVDYCNKKKLEFDYELFDLEDMTHLPTLRYLVDDRECNIVMYSIFALPEDESYRNRIAGDGGQAGRRSFISSTKICSWPTLTI